MGMLFYRFAIRYPSVYRLMQRGVWLPWGVLTLVAVQLAVWALDRDPPFALISAQVNSPKPGGVLDVAAVVRRDLGRDCSVTFSRYLFDHSGFRHESFGPQLMSTQALRDMDAQAPGRMNIRLRVPYEFPPGRGTMNTTLEYRCNPLQDVLRPINVQMNVPFEVVAP